jgi:hypothetical protein
MDTSWSHTVEQMNTLRDIGLEYLDIIKVWSMLPGFEERFALRGKTRLMALCRFHNEKTPSLRIWPKSRRFRCHGCHKTGDALHLLKLFEKCCIDSEELRHLSPELRQEEVMFFKNILEKYLRRRIFL